MSATGEHLAPTTGYDALFSNLEDRDLLQILLVNDNDPENTQLGSNSASQPFPSRAAVHGVRSERSRSTQKLFS